MSAKRYLAPWRRAAAAVRTVEPGGEGREVLAALEGKPAIYHCVSRAVWREMVFEDREKERFVLMLRKWEAFSRVRVLTYCMMTNHFHILVEVPERPQRDPSDEELLDHLGLIYGGRKLAQVRWELENLRALGHHDAAEAMRQRVLRRMWDLSVFMKALKQEFTMWWNKTHAKGGNLWEDKFKSVLVEDGHAAQVVAAYIDLNPVRAGIVSAAEDYRWSGWGEAVAGRKPAREGIRQVMLERELGRSSPEVALKDVSEWRQVVGAYRALLGQDLGREGKAEGKLSVAGGRSGRKRADPGMPASEAARVGGQERASEADLLRRRVRYFVDGLVIGSRGFVDGVFDLTRGWFGAGRRSGARKLVRAETALRTMRELRVRPYG